MELQYKVLRTIYEIVKDEAEPQTYLCKPREIILRLFLDWNTIYENLQLLEKQSFVRTQQHDTLVISITKEGIEKLKGPGVADERPEKDFTG